MTTHDHLPAGTTPLPDLPELGPGSPLTWANLVTLLRTVVAVVLAAWALVGHDLALLVAGYAVYWLGDMLDGFLARLMRQETRLGAVLDIVSDRACTALLGAALLTLRPDLLVVLAGFLLMFMVLDTVLSLAFLCWPLLSPNDFGRIDRAVYRCNWSPGAKAVNTSAVVLTALVGLTGLALVLVGLLTAVKVWSGLRVLRLLGEVPS